MNLTFSATIQGQQIKCDIGTNIAIAAPVFCFSQLAPATVVSGGTLVASVAGYTEIQLPNLSPDQIATLIIEYANPEFAPTNRAWLPLGPYLRHAGGVTPLPKLPAGVRPSADASFAPYDGLRLIPQPSLWQPDGDTLSCQNGFSAVSEPLQAVSDLAARNGLPPFLTSDGIPITISLSPDHPIDGYCLHLSPSAVTIQATDRAGIFNAGITLINLMAIYNCYLPCGTITDAPRFAWRGQHLDCARHFYEPATICRLLDLMALLKLNRFHWHFADDESFRLQVDCAPDLWQKTAFRGEGLPVPGVFGGGIRSGGSYSKADVAALVAHASALNIEVLPEIEVPAHAFAMNRAISSLRDPADNGQEASIQGYTENAINPALAATWALLEPLSLEVASLFPINILHLGCDELAPNTWDGSPAIRALKSREGLATRDDVQGWTMHRLAAHLATHGVRSAAWEEAARGKNGGIGNNAILFSWTGQGPGIDAARAGYDVVMSPAQNVYLDMAHTNDPDDWGAAWAAFIALEDTINWKPIPDGAEDVTHRIIGVEGCFWSEFTTSDTEMMPMLAPRILGVASKAWDINDSLSGPGLRALAGHYATLFDAIGWPCHKGA
jgi:hexosaminidase